MKVMVLGGGGMAGHMIAAYLKQNPSIDLFITSRNGIEGHIYLDTSDWTQVKKLIKRLEPDVVINCVGILNDFASLHFQQALLINGLLPHYLIHELETYGGKLIHLSTDCVFTGKRGNYVEKDEPDGESIYAKTKILGESKNEKHLVIRTSIIGPELKDGIGLFHWFFKQDGIIKGYQNVLWNGVTTLELAKFIEFAIVQEIEGLFHLASKEPISKGDLLNLMRRLFSKKNITIIPSYEPVSNKTLKNTRSDVVYLVPTYEEMLVELKGWVNTRCQPYLLY